MISVYSQNPTIKEDYIHLADFSTMLHAGEWLKEHFANFGESSIPHRVLLEYKSDTLLEEEAEEYKEIKEKVENAPEDAVWKIEMNVVTREDGTPGKPGEKTIEEFSKKEILEMLKAAYEYKRGDL